VKKGQGDKETRRQGEGQRSGLTLLEVIVSMAIFLIALGGIGPLIQMAQDRAIDVQLQATALQKCQSKMSEVIAGAVTLSSQSDEPFADNPPDENWLWSMDATQDSNGINNLWVVNVRVFRQMADNRKVEVALSQMVMDPSIRGAPNPPPQASATSSTTSSSSSSGSTTGGATTGGGTTGGATTGGTMGGGGATGGGATGGGATGGGAAGGGGGTGKGG
jgi:prepilin-type N-terminal cleavage/methylation domain-containing protein